LQRKNNPLLVLNNPGAQAPRVAAPKGSTQAIQTQAETLKKRARSKFFSVALAKELADLQSPLQRSYERTLMCAQIITQTGNKLSSTYCGGRWCVVCNRIRTAKLLNKYRGHLDTMHQPQFITLTIPNVAGGVADINAAIGEMQKFCRKSFDLLRKYGLKFRGFRKMEISYNNDRGDFHPHLHLLIDGEILKSKDEEKSIAKIYKIWKNRGLSIKRFEKLLDDYNNDRATAGTFKGELLLQMWLQYWPTAKSCAQDVRAATPGTLEELFKYSAKILTKSKGAGGRYVWSTETYTTQAGELREVIKRKVAQDDLIIYVSALDKIYRALYCKRVLQPIGYTKEEQRAFNEITEGAIEDDLQAQEFTDLDANATAYLWRGNDWHCIITGVRLTGYVPDDIDTRRVNAFVCDSG